MSPDFPKSEKFRVIYENEEIGVTHEFLSFQSGKEAVLCAWSIKNGKIIRIETGAMLVRRSNEAYDGLLAGMADIDTDDHHLGGLHELGQTAQRGMQHVTQPVQDTMVDVPTRNTNECLAYDKGAGCCASRINK